MAIGVTLGALLAGAVATTAQDRNDGTRAAGTGPRDCPPATARAAAQGMTAQAGGATAATSTRSGWLQAWMQGSDRWRNPVGAAGMYTGVDTGVTRGPALGASTGSTGTYGAGTESNAIISGGSGTPGGGKGSASSARTAARRDPC
jgi:hypothetical protein